MKAANRRLLGQLKWYILINTCAQRLFSNRNRLHATLSVWWPHLMTPPINSLHLLWRKFSFFLRIKGSPALRFSTEGKVTSTHTWRTPLQEEEEDVNWTIETRVLVEFLSWSPDMLHPVAQISLSPLSASLPAPHPAPQQQTLLRQTLHSISVRADQVNKVVLNLHRQPLFIHLITETVQNKH